MLHANIGRSTWEKIGWLREDSKISKDDLDSIQEAFSFLVGLRLMLQLNELSEGKTPGNHCNPKKLSNREQEQLKTAFKAVNLLIQILKDIFQLDLIAH